ncbi:Aromatic-ring-hydroxylating dioxygenase alpha subunit, partial [Penicillium sp. DV-2018c]
MSIVESCLDSKQTESSHVSTFPASWYSSQGIYELERRAIFSRKWLLTTHKLRFPQTGDWLRYNIAGYAFILVKDREGNINAFHNICRHRAFPVVTEEGGTSRIFSCQYHGWSYGLNGKLAKAPGYQDMEGFDKSKNGLLPIHVHIDINGFIWLNLDAGEKPETSWEDDIAETDLQPRFNDFSWEDYSFDHTWELTGEYNWKIMADDFSKRYHQSKDLLAPVAGLSSHADGADDGTVVHSTNSPSDRISKNLMTATTYYFPNTSMTVLPDLFIIQRFVPTSPTTCSIRYEIYRGKSSSDEDFMLINEVHKRTMTEANGRCGEVQRNLDSGVFVSDEGPLQIEKSLVPFQVIVHDLIVAHQKREEDAGEEIWPARQRLPSEATVSKDDMDFCSKLTSNESNAKAGCCGGGCGAGPPTKPATAPETMV